jgi:hypothetical protein
MRHIITAFTHVLGAPQPPKQALLSTFLTILVVLLMLHGVSKLLG